MTTITTTPAPPACASPAGRAAALLLIENRRPRAMFLCVLLGGLTVALTIGLLDVLVFHADAINSQKTVSAGVDLAIGLLLLAAGGLVVTGRLHGRPKVAVPVRAGSRGNRRGRRRTAGRSGCWLSPGSGSPCWPAR